MDSLRKSDDISFEVKGADMQYVEVMLKPGQAVISQPGSMMYMEQGVQMSTKLSDGSEEHSGLLGSITGLSKRYMSGEKLFVTFYTNNDTRDHMVAFAGSYLGRIQDIDLSACGGEIMCQKGAFLCSAKGTAISVGFNKKMGASLFGGDGFILQKLTGDGVVFINASGSIEEFTLKENQTVFVETGCLVGFQKGVDYDVQVIKGIKNIMFGGEDLFLIKLTGPGKVWAQSMPYGRLIGQITYAVATILNSKK